MNGAVFSSDMRLEYTSAILQQSGNSVIEARTALDANEILEKDPAWFDFVVLPIRASEDGQIELSNQLVPVDSLLRSLRSGIPVFTGRRTDYLESLNLNLHIFFEDEELAQKNAAITAEGVLYVLMNNTSRSLYEYDYDLLGAGKTGGQIYKLLQRLGLQVRLVTRYGENGTVPYERWREAEPARVVINTVPGQMVTSDMLPRWTGKILLLDLSSGMKGADATVKAAQSIRYLAAPPLPGLVAPESAGKLLADYIQLVLACGKG